jgi:hypothetical protein
MVFEMNGLKTLEQQRLSLKAIGNVLATADIGLIKDSASFEYSPNDFYVDVMDFRVGFSCFNEAKLGQKIIDECKKLGL